MTLTKFIHTLNEWGSQQIPFLFLVDFEMEAPQAIKLDHVDPSEILFDINGFTNRDQRAGSTGVYPVQPDAYVMEKQPIPLEDYAKKFNTVYDRLCYGDSYLTNLTAKTPIRLAHTLEDLFFITNAKYKLLYKNEFLVFSPETFIQIADGKIFSYPMKGTIDASVTNAKEKIVNDQKELAEHVTIVDLIRNDLSRVSTNVTVTRFRYLEELKTNHKNLLQVSSEIVGTLSAAYSGRIGNILATLLPAGSVSGAPKPKTVEIIRAAEGEKRGYYTGIFGYFNGKKLDSGVMIRFIENKNDKLVYRSGGGITTQSVVETEYQELIDKVYVPVN